MQTFTYKHNFRCRRRTLLGQWCGNNNKTMPSRKKAQGKARKAAKAEKAEEEGKKQSAVGANTEQQQAVSAQIQRLQLYKICFQNTSTTMTPTIIIDCMGILHCQRTLSLMIAKVRLVFM